MQENYYLFFFLALLAEILGTVSGFGSSILFVPLASMFLDFKLVLGITAVFHVFSNLSKIYLFQSGIDKEIALKLGIPAVIAVIIGAILTHYIPQKQTELGMNVLVFCLAIYLLGGGHKKIKQSDSNLYIGGGISGFLAGLIGTGGAIRGLTLSAFQLPKDIFIATSALIDMGVDTSRAIIYVANGYFTKEYIVFIPFLIGISMTGSFLGKKILHYMPEKVFHDVVLGIILLMSAIQTGKYLIQ
jgi:uncharacterized membrane protein YfcA